MLLCPRSTETLSSGTPEGNSSTANVSRNLCACPFGTLANSNAVSSLYPGHVTVSVHSFGELQARFEQWNVRVRGCLSAADLAGIHFYGRWDDFAYRTENRLLVLCE